VSLLLNKMSKHSATDTVKNLTTNTTEVYKFT